MFLIEAGERLTRRCWLSFQSADFVNSKHSEQEDDGEVGFRFGDGYDFRSPAGEPNFKGVSDEATATVAVEADAVEVGIEAGIVGEDDTAGVRVIVDLCSVLGGSTPVPDGEIGAAAPGTHAAEA